MNIRNRLGKLEEFAKRRQEIASQPRDETAIAARLASILDEAARNLGLEKANLGTIAASDLHPANRLAEILAKARERARAAREFT